jgi:predicted nucleic acid-binding protein
MRVVLGKNVLVAELLSASGPPAWMVEATLAGALEPVCGMAIPQEQEAVLLRPEFEFPSAHVDGRLVALQGAAVAPWPVPPLDLDDEPLRPVAATTARVLVTGNLRHFPARSRRGVSVLTPRGSVDRLGRRKP